MIRQFQIQRGAMEGLLNQYMIDEETHMQDKYFIDDNEDEESEEDGGMPDYIYLQEFQDEFDYWLL